MAMDVNQLMVALIGASSTLIAAWVGSRSRQKPGTTPSKRSLRRRVFKLAFYFVVGGVATYWLVSWLYPNVHVEDQLQALGVTPTRINRTNVAFAQGKDSVVPPSLPVGSVILSVLPPEQLDRLPGGSTYWVPADGRALDTSSSYAILTGNTRVPDLRGISFARVPGQHVPSDSVTQAQGLYTAAGARSDSIFYWYVRVN
jgi:hypothetical protein